MTEENTPVAEPTQVIPAESKWGEGISSNQSVCQAAILRSGRQDRKHKQVCAIIRGDNAKLLAGFSRWLSGTYLHRKAIRQQVQDVEVFINTFLLSDQVITARRGVNWVAAFLSRKSIGASPNSLLEHAASLKKFYTYLNEKGKTNDEELQAVKKAIKIGMPGWLARVELGLDASEPTSTMNTRTVSLHVRWPA